MLATIEAELALRGYVHHQSVDQRQLVDFLEALGDVLHVEEVLVDPRSGALVKSKQPIAFHTDHHRAARILWHCKAQTSLGGETLLVDARRAYESIDEAHRRELENVMLSEHDVFRDDGGRHPLVSKSAGEIRIYYSLWLVEHGLSEAARAAVEAFAAALEHQEPIRLRLQPGDVLVVDNRRMLHARAAILGDGQRHLRRYWLTERKARLAA